VAQGNLCDWGFLVTLGDCHHQDGMVDCGLRYEVRVVIVRCSREKLMRGIVLTPWEITKSNSSRARHEGRQVVRSIQSARACGKHSTWESVTCGSPLARGPAATMELVSTRTSLMATK